MGHTAAGRDPDQHLRGFATLVEAAALTVLYAIVVECLVYRELRVSRDIPNVALESVTMVGGFMIILGVALGLTNYLIIAQIPMHALAWVQERIHSPALFLLALNVLLIIVGALMDIYSAIIVVVPPSRPWPRHMPSIRSILALSFSRTCSSATSCHLWERTCFCPPTVSTNRWRGFIAPPSLRGYTPGRGVVDYVRALITLWLLRSGGEQFVWKPHSLS